VSQKIRSEVPLLDQLSRDRSLARARYGDPYNTSSMSSSGMRSVPTSIRAVSSPLPPHRVSMVASAE
jgi:hypothetical protein